MFKLDKNKIEFQLWLFFVEIAKFIGINKIPTLSKFLSYIFFYLIPIRKNVTIGNLKKAFPEKSDREISQIAFDNYQSIGITFLEIMAFNSIPKEEILSMAEVNNFELAQQKIDEGNGVIFLTAHFANWELGALIMGLLLNSQINVLVKKQRNKLVADWMSGMRERFTNKEVPLGVSVRELYKTLYSGGAVGIVGDQRSPKKDGVVVNFFNIPTYSFQGFAALGIKKNIPIIVVLGKRLKSGKYQMDIEEISYENLTGELPDKLKELNQRYFNILEKRIKEAPEQWLWMHNIWKY